MVDRDKNIKRLLFITLSIIIILLAMPTVSQAHIVTEISWHPVPVAYLHALFYANLGSNINWDLIAAEFASTVNGEGYRSQASL